MNFINYLYLTNIYRILHRTAKYTFFPNLMNQMHSAYQSQIRTSTIWGITNIVNTTTPGMGGKHIRLPHLEMQFPPLAQVWWTVYSHKLSNAIVLLMLGQSGTGEV